MILTITLNTAIDHLIFVNQIKSNALNRVNTSIKVPGGKGINIACSLSVLGEEVIAAGFLGGKDSRFVEVTLQNLGVTTNFVYQDSEIRTDMYLVESKEKRNTLIVEKGLFVKPRFLKSFLDSYKRTLNNVDTVVIAGSIPPGIEANFVGELIDIANYRDVKVVINNKEDVIKKVFSHRNIEILKPDLRDVSKYDGLNYSLLSNRLLLADKATKNGAKIFILNYEPFKYIVSTRHRSFEVITTKAISNIMSLIAVEDGFLAGFLMKYLANEELEVCAKFGLAVAISNSQTKENFPNSLEDVENNLRLTKISEIL